MDSLINNIGRSKGEIMNWQNRFFAIEGIDGAGKTTLLKQIKEMVNNEKYKDFQFEFVANQPLGKVSNLSRHIRSILVEEGMNLGVHAQCAILFAARYENIAKVIIPALEQGKIVLTDRWTPSTDAYQGIALGHSDDSVHEFIRLLEYAIEDAFPNTDYDTLQYPRTYILDIPVEVALERIRKYRLLDNFEEGMLDKLDILRKSYLDYSKRGVRRDYRIVLNGEIPTVQLAETVLTRIIELQTAR